MGGGMEKFTGVTVSSGIAIARAFVVDDLGFAQSSQHIALEQVVLEQRRLRGAVSEALSDLKRDRESTTRELGETVGDIFEAHRVLLDNPAFIGEMEQQIQTQLSSAESAVTAVCSRYAKMLAGIGNERNALDIEDIRKRLSSKLIGNESFLQRLDSLDSPVVILAHNLTPSETAALPLSHVRGFATEQGGPASHTAILATALNIPAVLGVNSFLSHVESGDTLIVDGDQGMVIVRPDNQTLDHYLRRFEKKQSQDVQRLAHLRDLSADTLDGTHIMLLANIEFPEEIPAVLDYGAEGVGLYRTEFLHLGKDQEPDEEAHYEAYCTLLRALGERPLTIRTFDLGADKVSRSLGADLEKERNPNLGLRSIRLSLRCLEIFRTQLRAILRASAYGGKPHPFFRVMLPMVTAASEVRRARTILSDLKEDLDDQGIAYNPDLSLGIMVETPATVVKLNHFCQDQKKGRPKKDWLVRFLSIGTNDLVQYTLAVDRDNREVRELYREADPAVIYMLQQTVRCGREAGIPVSCCGQMAANPMYLMLLLGLGLTILSMPPKMIPKVKELIRSVSIEDCRQIAHEALGFEEARDVENFLRLKLREYDHDYIDPV